MVETGTGTRSDCWFGARTGEHPRLALIPAHGGFTQGAYHIPGCVGCGADPYAGGGIVPPGRGAA